jgi:DNA uptake protein ComE-like DNA-binding protein
MSDLHKLKRTDLLKIAQKAKIKGYSRAKKDELIDMIKKHKGVDVKVKDKNKNPTDNRVYVNIYCSGAKVESSGLPQTQKFITTTSNQSQQTQPLGKTPVRKFPPVKTTKPLQKIPPQKLSQKAEKLKEKTSRELSKLPKSQVSADFKNKLAGLFGNR